MRVCHETRNKLYREPFGAISLGTSVTLRVKVWDAAEAAAFLRLWIDDEGEILLPMRAVATEDGTLWEAVLTPEKTGLLWYQFVLKNGEETRYYGARQGRSGGEGELRDWLGDSFQMTVYRERIVPDWYKKGIAYQIFPDRFARGEDWEECTERALRTKRNGPERRCVEDWNTTPFYERDAEGRITAWDFYGGNLRGIREKLPYLKELGITVLYLNPVFEAASNHRYDTADYRRVDEMLGGDAELKELFAAAEQEGISIILDGVFNHTGCDSRYFNKYENYPEPGAWQGDLSPYRSWFRFDDSPIGYDCWWGVDDLPNVEESSPSYQDFIYGDRDSVIRHYLAMGAKGWRLDVADELPDAFIAGLKKAAVEQRDDALVLGEVWEDASHKISYGERRQYLMGQELDSVMNYVLRDHLLGYLLGKETAEDCAEALMSLRENYPKEAFYSTLNLLGSHDRPRLMTCLGEAPDDLPAEERRDYRLETQKLYLAKNRFWLAVLVQMTLPGVPCVYYGDEAGMQGFSDPYNRGPYPWGEEDKDAMTMVQNAIRLRQAHAVFTDGEFRTLSLGTEVFGFERWDKNVRMVVLVNRSPFETVTVTVPVEEGKTVAELMRGQEVNVRQGSAEITLWPFGSAVLQIRDGTDLARTMERGCGVLCHITSLPGKTGQGTMGPEAYAFVDALAEGKQKYWQILPLNRPDENGSPYAGVSAFAGNVRLLSGSEEERRSRYLKEKDSAAFAEFCQREEDWLKPYATFLACKDLLEQKPWTEWPMPYATYTPELAERMKKESEYYAFEQYCFQEEWQDLRRYANEKGIRIIGDLSMFVTLDSADVWQHPDLFQLDEDHRKTTEAGVPPDAFAEEGQTWGNPLFRWDRMKQDGYRWWIARLRRAFDLYDVTRLDHFRGFESYWEVPAGEKALKGSWKKGPGLDLFRKAYEALGPLPVIAEDLGFITPQVRCLVASCGFPGMEVLQFFDGDPMEDYAPCSGKIGYTGTHDNETLLGWCRNRYGEARAEECWRTLLERAATSPEEVCIFPIQDILGLGNEARMNVPGTLGKNWCWQMKTGLRSEEIDRLRTLAEQHEKG